MDEIDAQLLRLGCMDTGALCDGLTRASADTLARCERMAAAGLMVEGGALERGVGHPPIRAFHTTPRGVQAHGAFGVVSAKVQ